MARQGNFSPQKIPRGGTTTFAYDALMREIRRKLPNGLVTVKGYDAACRLTKVKTDGGPVDQDKKLSNEAYVHNASSQRTYTVDENGRITACSYGPARRLSQVLYPFRSGKGPLTSASSFALMTPKLPLELANRIVSQPPA